MGIVITHAFAGTDGTELFSWNADLDNHPSYPPVLEISNANRCRTGTTGGAGARCYYSATDPGDDTYYVQAKGRYMSYDTVSGQTFGLAARISTSANTMYMVRHNPVSGQWQLYKIVAGAATLIGTPYSQTFVAGDEMTIRLDVRSSGTRVELSVDGVSRITDNDTAITARGFGGMREGSGQAGGNSIHMHLDDFIIGNALGVVVARQRRLTLLGVGA